MKPLPTPISAIGSTSCHIGVSGRMTAASQSRLTAKHDNPNAAIPRGWTRSVSRPTYGARHVEITADGARSSAAPVGRQSAYALGVERDRERLRRDREPECGDRDVGEREVAVAEERKRDQRLRCTGLPHHEQRQYRDAADDQRPRDRAPREGLPLLDAEHEQEHPDGTERHADEVEPADRRRQRGHQPDGEHEPENADGHVDEEDPLPAEAVDQQPAGDRPDEHRDPGHRPPQAHRPPALVRRERAGDHGHGLRRQHRRAEALHDPRHDQPADRPGEPAPQGGDGEHGEADQVHTLGAVPVAEPAGDQQRDRVSEQVGAGDPDDGVDVRVERRHDRGRRDGHDRRIDENHEEPEHQCPHRGPGARDLTCRHRSTVGRAPSVSRADRSRVPSAPSR